MSSITDLEAQLHSANAARQKAELALQAIERKLLETQRLESLGVLAGGIAHDFNNLLTTMLGNAELALFDLPETAPVRAYIQEIAIAARRAAGLTGQMLAYAGKQRFLLEQIDLGSLVVEMAYLLKASIPKHIAVSYRLASRLPSIQGDPSQIRQIVMNLIVNAAEAIGEEHGQIIITVEGRAVTKAMLADARLGADLPADTYVCLEVSDTGQGMDAATIAKIFEPFFTTKFTGRGLGLAAVLGIVRGHKSALSIKSAPMSGTTFTVLFPIAERAEALPDAAEAPLEAQTAPITVLVIDDEETIRSAVTGMLERLGCRVLTADSGAAAIALFLTQIDMIACILLDLTLTDMSGEILFQQLRQIKPDARIILMSGYAEEEATSRFAGMGLASFVQKPFTIHELTDRLQRAMMTTIEE